MSRAIYELIMDTRGDAQKLVKEYFKEHPKIAERFTVTPTNNQKYDVIVREVKTGRILMLFELKLKDLYNSIVKKILNKELADYLEYSKLVRAPVFLVAAPTYGVSISPLQQSFILISVMNHFPSVRYWLVSTPKKVIEKMIKTVERPPDFEFIDKPVVKHDSELERFAQSIASLHKGTSFKVALEIAKGWRKDMDLTEFLELVNSAHNDGRNHVKQATDLYEVIQRCWLRG